MTQWGLDTLFNPAKRHMDEEKRRLQSTREEIGDSSGGKRIDLESGKVVIRRDAGDDEPDESPESAAPAEAVDADPSAEPPAEPPAAKGKPAARATESAAQARARARRAKKTT
jgi:hypothetical protein